MTATEPVRITATVVTTSPDVVARAVESFARAAAGLVLERVSVEIFAGPEEDDESVDEEVE